MLIKLALLLVSIQHYYHDERHEAHTAKAERLRVRADEQAALLRKQARAADSSADAEYARKSDAGYLKASLQSVIARSFK